ncbi:glycosyl hydrolase family 8 [Candidatus Pantoea soli]|uniref:cellulase n=1 Tax=Candidatus Pantoea soli TaxID=3098669 RepID=A0A518X8H0_9GAMM|nr:glycosyl hydrolase family 8 [Pantoea soli]QDY40482.1 endoglucanase [Pantoea soli]
MKMMRLWRQWMLCFMVMCFSAQAAADGWSTYKSRFMRDDGRIIDTANNNVSHTEGQGYGMLLAVANNDRATFDRLWQWTRTHLRNPQNDLFWWRYTPDASDPVADKNDAADGNVLIAWALQRAAQKWGGDYQQASDRIQRAVVKHTVISYAGYTVMLPGAQGFNKTSYVVLNPSYFLFTAWREFARHSHLRVWNSLIDDGMTLLGKMQFGKTGLPLDWVALNADGSLAPALGYSNRFSYDAIRVPLNIWWYDPQSLRLVPFQRVWQGYPRQSTPAWFDVLANTPAPYNMDGGLTAVRDLTLNETRYLTDQLTPQQNYFSASLQLLTWLAYQEKH